MMGRHKTYYCEGFSHTVRKVSVAEKHAIRGRAYALSFQSAGRYIGDVPEIPMVIRVRCQRHKHKIILWPDGNLTLASHAGGTGMQAAKVAEMMGQTIRCFDVIKAWRECMAGEASRKHLPKELQPVSDVLVQLRKSRRAYCRRSSDEPLRIPFSKRIREAKQGAVERAMGRMNEGTRGSIPWNNFSRAFRYYGKIDANLPGVDDNRLANDEWLATMFPSGIGLSDLEISGKRFFPVSVPKKTIIDEEGWCLAHDEGLVWLWIERVGPKEWKAIRVGE